MTRDLIPETASEALARWDTGENVFTVSMGGLGPGYEQAIQMLAFEMIRDATTGVAQMPSAEMPEEDWRKWGDEAVGRLDQQAGGFTGAMVGAAKSLASMVLIRGYRAALDIAPKDRLIQVSRKFPVAS